MLRFPSRRPRWLALSAFGAATMTAVSCDTSLSFRPNELLWGFVTVSALKDGTGALRTSPTGVFFRGEVTSIPNSGLRPDSCFPPNNYVPPVNNFGGVLYLDAGPSVSVKLGTQTNEIPRVSGGGTTTYKLDPGATVGYGSGDSIVVQVPGATGGYPTATIRGKAAEAFILQPLTPSPSAPIQLRWNAPSDTGSSLVLSLQYAPAGGNGQITREIRCAFKDDGVDSIVVTQHRTWSDSTNLLRQVVATRLRTVLFNVGDGGLQLISTFQYPTPQP